MSIIKKSVQDVTDIRKLDDSQLESFDTDYVEGNRWDTITSRIDRDFPSGRFRFLDVGGGNGKLADRLLDSYPHANGTVLDNSELLLNKNTANNRKKILLASVDDLGNIQEEYDLICVHWLLHHLVSDRYATTRRHQLATLNKLRKLLSDKGRISVFENMYTGWWIESLPGWLIFQLTSASNIASFTRRMGANTAGVGVCFLSRKQWYQTIENANLNILDYLEPDDWTWPLRNSWRFFLHLQHVRVAHFWLSQDYDC